MSGAALQEYIDRILRNRRQHARSLAANPHRSGCCYRQHVYMVGPGTFWRCRHGRADRCPRCAIAHPLLYLRWHALPFIRRHIKHTVTEGGLFPNTIAGAAQLVYDDDYLDDVVLWARLPSFDYVHDFQRNLYRMRQRVLVWHSRRGWFITWR